jgi:hypothetical protein
MLVAVDTQVSKKAVRQIESAGHWVVYIAGEEHDEWWFREALDLDAEVFISPDFDIEILANQYDKKFIRIPQRIDDMGSYLVRQLRLLKQNRSR